jgi:hypothetical protein
VVGVTIVIRGRSLKFEELRRIEESELREKENVNKREYIKKILSDLKLSDNQILLTNFIDKHQHLESWPEEELYLLKALLVSKGYEIYTDQLLDLLELKREEAFYEVLSNYLNENLSDSLDSFISAIVCSPINDYEHALSYIEQYMEENKERYQFDFDEEKFLSLIDAKLKKKKLEEYEKNIRRGDFSSINEVDCMLGSEFESFLGKLFTRMGFDVSVTQLSGDQGADLVIGKNGTLTVVQAKRYSGKVGNKAVQEVVAAKGFYEAKNAMVVTNNEFTPAAYSLAKKNTVELVDRKKLEEWISLYF